MEGWGGVTEGPRTPPGDQGALSTEGGQEEEKPHTSSGAGLALPQASQGISLQAESATRPRGKGEPDVYSRAWDVPRDTVMCDEKYVMVFVPFWAQSSWNPWHFLSVIREIKVS